MKTDTNSLIGDLHIVVNSYFYDSLVKHLQDFPQGFISFEENIFNKDQKDTKNVHIKVERIELKEYYDKKNMNEKKNDSIRIQELELHLEEMKKSLQEATACINTFRQQQQQICDDYSDLKEKYEEIKDINHNLLWADMKTYSNELQYIPPLSNDVIESIAQIGPYQIHEMIGEGHFACVYSCNKDNETNLSVKVIEKEKINDVKSLFRLNAELKALQDPVLKHEWILNLKDVIHTRGHIYIFTERGGKDLFDYFENNHHGVQEKIAKKVLKKLVEALYHIHSSHYCHRDLKPENILLKENEENLKIIDFGLCRKVKDNERIKDDFCGSPGFFAPEMILKNEYDGKKSDVWSIGCILLELILGHELFASMWMSAYANKKLQHPKVFQKSIEQSTQDVLNMIRKDSKFSTYSNELKSLLYKMLIIEPNNRCDIEDIINSKYFMKEKTITSTNILLQHQNKTESSLAIPSFDLSSSHITSRSGSIQEKHSTQFPSI